ncbi:hypothetical protein [Streptomyces sp. NPDC051577]|uniref:hypothetical protein n=1 Tax=Streptomyces sp. NPDC051577 TaxID=3155166 RepID=UPI00343A417F
MSKSDEELLDFDQARLADWDSERAKRALEGGDGAIYRNHLAIAQWIDDWARNLEGGELRESPTEFNEGFIKGIRELAAHLRQTDLLPDGILLRENGY